MKYIDAEKLREEIEFARAVYSNPHRVVHGIADAFRQDGHAAMCEEILKKIDSLQQEQSEIDDIAREWYNKGYLKGRQEAYIPARELGLPKALDFKPLDEDLERDAVNFCHDNGLNTTPHIAKTIAKHFYELGLNAEK